MAGAYGGSRRASFGIALVPEQYTGLPDMRDGIRGHVGQCDPNNERWGPHRRIAKAARRQHSTILVGALSQHSAKIRAPARPMGSSPESRRSVRKREAMEGSAVSRRQAKDAPGAILTLVLMLLGAVHSADGKAEGDSCMKRWETGPYAKGPPMYMRDPFNHEHHVAHKIYAKPMSLPDFILERGRSSGGDLRRLRDMFLKLDAGSPINVVVIGGSITCGGNTYTEDQRWINQVFQWINSTWPHPEHKLRNACKPATPSMLFSFCMHQSVPDDTDLLLMEFTVNDNAGVDQVRGGGLPDLPVMENEWRRGLERTFRKALQVPSKPAVLYLHVYQPDYEEHSFWQGGESQIETIVKYYGIPSISARDALYHLEMAGADGFADKQLHCGVHPNPLGHTYYADLVIGALQDVAFQALSRVGHRHHNAIFRPLNTLPLPMLKDNYESASDCLREDDLRQAAVEGETEGWEWVDEGKKGRSPKLGWRTMEPVRSITLNMPSTVSTLANYAGKVVMGVGYLQSYEHMGIFKIECVSGCECEGVPSKNANWGSALSIYQTAYLAVSQSPVCQIRITSLPNTTSDGHKIKFDTVLVATGMTESWSKWFNQLGV